jgi:hypothetical protein
LLTATGRLTVTARQSLSWRDSSLPKARARLNLLTMRRMARAKPKGSGMRSGTKTLTKKPTATMRPKESGSPSWRSLGLMKPTATS